MFICVALLILYLNYLSNTFIISLMCYTLSLLDTSDDEENIEFVCPDPVFDPERIMYNISVMWNITNPLLSEAVGTYLLFLNRINTAQPDSSFSQFARLPSEVETVNTVLCKLTLSVYIFTGQSTGV